MSSERTSILAANAAFYSAIAKGDYRAMELLWARLRPVACIHPGWSAITGRNQVMASWRTILTRPPAIKCSDPKVFPLGEAAMVLCREIIGQTVLAATNIFVREAETWKLIHHQAGPTPEVAEEAPPRQRMH